MTTSSCPKCGNSKFKGWRDLTDDERLIVECLPGSAEYTPEERKKHRFCTRCFYEMSVHRRSVDT